MKVPSTDLFDLIQSMSKTEKGYFKKYAKLHTIGDQNNYLRLFDVIAKQPEYDENKVIERFKNENFTKSFTVAKTYLHKLVLKALKNYYAENNTVSGELYDELQTLNILLLKGLYKESWIKLKRIKKIISKHQHFFLLPEIYRIEYTLRSKSRAPKGSPTYEDLFKEVRKGLKLPKNYFNLVQQFSEVNDIIVNKPNYNKEVLEKKSAELLGQETMDEKYPKSVISKFGYYQMKFHLLYNLGKIDACKKVNANLRDLVKGNANQLLNVSVPVIMAYSNMSIFSIINYNYKEAEKTINEGYEFIQKVENTKRPMPHDYTLSKLLLLSAYFRLNLMLGEYEKNIKALSDHVITINKYFDAIPAYSSALYAYIAMSYLALGNFDEALDWSNRVDGLKESIMQLKLGNLINKILIHLEMGNYIYLENLLPNIARNWKGKSYLPKTQKALFTFVKKIFKKTGAENLQVELKELITSLELLKSSEEAHDSFFILTWAKSKYQNTSMSEVIKRQLI